LIFTGGSDGNDLIRNGRDHKDVRPHSKYLDVFSVTLFFMTFMIFLPFAFSNTFCLSFFSTSLSLLSFLLLINFLLICQYSFLLQITTTNSLLNRAYTLYLHTVPTHYKVYVLTIIAGKYEANKSGKSVRGEDVFVWSTPVVNSLCRNISTHRLLPGRCHR
jgi:hypothetical protein